MNEARTRKVSQTKVFWYSFLLSPLIGALVVFTSKEKEEREKFIWLPIIIVGSISVLIFMVNISINIYQDYKREKEMEVIIKEIKKDSINNTPKPQFKTGKEFFESLSK
jgi:uncharacterized membrane protein